MSCAEDFKDDFGPVRLASEEDIRKARSQRQKRYNHFKSSDPTHDLNQNTLPMPGRHGLETQAHKTNNSSLKGMDSDAPQERILNLSGKEELINYLEEEKLKKKRKLYLSGQDELIKYLENEKLKKAKAHQVIPQMEVFAKTPRMMIPVEDAERQKILAQLEAKRQKSNPKQAFGLVSTETSAKKTEADTQIEVSSISSELEFDDASEYLSPDPLQEGGLKKAVDLEVTSLETAENTENKAGDERNSVAEDTRLATTNDFQPFETQDTQTQETTKANDSFCKENEEASSIGTEENETETGAKYGSKDVDTMRRLILSQLNGNKPLQLDKTSLYPAYSEIYSVLSHTIHDSESHTVLLTGASGSGKTEVVKQAMSKLQELSGDKFITIRLSGTLHTTEQHAIREIARQLDEKLTEFGKDSGEDTYEQRAISDTFHNILSTLSKIDELANMESERELLIRVVFLIDEIEKLTENPRQTLLYNLFELAQLSKVPICILGITPRVTIRDFFEKRVKSRFSQRMVQTKRADDIETFWQDAKVALTVAESDFDHFADKDYPQQWNKNIEQLFRAHTGLKRIFYTAFFTTKSYRQIYNQCALPVSKIGVSSPFPQSAHFEVFMQNDLRGIEAKILSLSPVELLVVIAAARWVARSDTPQVNFKLAYREYTEMMKTNNLETTTLSSKTSYIDNMSLTGIKVERKIHSPKVLHSCWRFVYRSGLLFDVISNNNEVNANNNLYMYKESMIDDSKMLQLDISLEELAKLIPGDNYVRRFTRL